MRRHAVVIAALLVAHPAAAKDQDVWKELIFCTRFASGLHQALTYLGEGESKDAKDIHNAFLGFAFRANKAIPIEQTAEAMELIKTSNEAVTQLLLPVLSTDPVDPDTIERLGQIGDKCDAL